MEISPDARPVTGGQNAILRQDLSNQKAGTSVAERQDLPPTGKIPEVVKANAPPQVPEFETKDLDAAMKDLRSFVQKLGRDLDFRRDEQLGKNIVTVRDEKTRELVRQIPAEEILAMSRQIADSLNALKAGLMLDDQA